MMLTSSGGVYLERIPAQPATNESKATSSKVFFMDEILYRFG